MYMKIPLIVSQLLTLLINGKTSACRFDGVQILCTQSVCTMDIKLAARSAVKSEHDIDPHNFLIPQQIIQKYPIHVYLECNFA